jgi:hypothetical protein
MDRYDLMSLSKEELIALVDKLMDKLTEKERLDFVLRWISPQAALKEASEHDDNSFIERVDFFCKECLDGKYFFEVDYEQYHDYYYDDDEEIYNYNESEWAEKFTIFLKLSVMYAKDKNYAIAYTTLDQLMSCLHEAEFDENILGTDNPMDYIEIDWDEVFDEYYISMKSQLSDKKQLASKAVDVWIGFGDRCTEGILNNINDINHVEDAIRYNIFAYSENWIMQRELYKLLKNFYIKQNIVFDEIAMPESMLSYSQNFTYDLAQGYICQQKWSTAVEIILDACKVVDNERVLEALNVKLIDCYNELKQYDKGLVVAVSLFKKYPKKHDYYLKARKLASKVEQLDFFVKDMISFAKTCNEYNSTEILLKIHSSEGHINDMVNVALKAHGFNRHDYMKYAFKSLVYRALKDKDKENIPLDLKGLIAGLEYNKIPGIVDMADNTYSLESERALLQSAISILKEIIQFHINAAKRTRYSRAAYYCSLVRGVYIYLNEKDEFEHYYDTVVIGNKRRPALRDEMRKALSET